MIKAIETKYKGYNFRSRLEARWAVFLDTLGIKWRYEVEEYDLGELGYYLPDFVVTGESGESVFLEVKGEPIYKKQRNVYLAGAMASSRSGKEWRPSDENFTEQDYAERLYDKHYAKSFNGHRRVGPFGINQWGGHGPGGHTDGDAEDLELQNLVHAGSLEQIKKCDLFFAWLESAEQHGTVAEIGYAKGLGKEIWIGTPNRNAIHNLWFAVNMADKVCEASAAWKAFAIIDAPSTIEEKKCLMLSWMSEGGVILLSGDPGADTHYANLYWKGHTNIAGGTLNLYKNGVTVIPRGLYTPNTYQKLLDAHAAARSARFEHGANPQPRRPA